MTSIENLLHHRLAAFEAISLEEMEAVRLMDRTDRKFMLPAGRLPEILELAEGSYRIMEIDRKRIFSYETLYYDTPRLDLFRSHQANHLNRFKIRTRNYKDTQTVFFEVKKKTNKGRTVKMRVPQRAFEDSRPDQHGMALLRSCTPFESGDLVPALWVFYSRFTLVNTGSRERVTIDVNLKFRSGEGEERYDGLVIVEVKQPGFSGESSPFIRLLRERKVKEGRISKYCLGIATLFNHVKKNQFKAKVRSIQKLIKSDVSNPLVRYS